MQKFHRQRPSVSRAISHSEFYDALCSIWHPPQGPKIKGRTLGLAVSGGVDSTALAHLCVAARYAPQGRDDYFFKFHAFIVDHKARPSSTAEAKWVSLRLRSWGIPTTILPLEWPRGVQPGKLPNFETQARRLRYQALGAACRDRLITSLLLAHHEDDQAESMLLRIARGHNMSGLLGIQPVADLPECQGIYGVHQSGTPEMRKLLRGFPTSEAKPQSLLEKPNPSSIFEEGGVKVYRPLLEFSKERLIETCLASHLGWVEDKTNHDPTMSPRNAVRYLLGNTDLPRSLQKPSLLALRQRMIQKDKSRMGRVNNAFKACDIRMLDTRSGSLVVRLRVRCWSWKNIPIGYHQARLIEAQHTAALLLRQLLHIVTPQKQVSLQSLQFAAYAVYPELKDMTATRLDKYLAPSKFSAAGVSFTRVESPWEPPNGGEARNLDRDFLWVLHREPYHSTEEVPTIQIDPFSVPETHSGRGGDSSDQRSINPTSPTLSTSETCSTLLTFSALKPQSSVPRPHQSTNISPTNQSTPTPQAPQSKVRLVGSDAVLYRPLSYDSLDQQSLTKHPEHPPHQRSYAQNLPIFHLWDSRFWFRIENPTPHQLLIRPFCVQDLHQIRTLQSPAEVKRFESLLHSAAPAKIRWTLPVLVQKGTANNNDNNHNNGEEAAGTPAADRILSLPTLGCDYGAESMGVRCEVRYKQVDLGPLTDMDRVVVGFGSEKWGILNVE